MREGYTPKPEEALQLQALTALYGPEDVLELRLHIGKRMAALSVLLDIQCPSRPDWDELLVHWERLKEHYDFIYCLGYVHAWDDEIGEYLEPVVD